MTTPSTERKAGPLLGTGVQTTWPFTFKVFAATDIAVTIADSLGVETALTYGVDYTVTLNVNQETSPGGTVTYPISGTPLPVGSRLVIFGNLPYDQPLDLPAGGNFSPLALENELDRLTMQIQQLRERVGRALQVSVTTGANVGLPAPSANELIGWDSTGQNLQNFALNELATAVAYATMHYDTFTGDGVETQFTLTADPVTLANLDVAISGVTQVPGSDYSLVNGVLVFASAPANGTEILARYGEGLVNVGGDSSDIRFLPAGAGAQETTAQDKLRKIVNISDFIPAGINTAVVDCRSYIQAALNAYPNNVIVRGAGKSYRITGSIYIRGNNKTLDFEGGSLTLDVAATNQQAVVMDNPTATKTYFPALKNVTIYASASTQAQTNITGVVIENGVLHPITENVSIERMGWLSLSGTGMAIRGGPIGGDDTPYYGLHTNLKVSFCNVGLYVGANIAYPIITTHTFINLTIGGCKSHGAYFYNAQSCTLVCPQIEQNQGANVRLEACGEIYIFGGFNEGGNPNVEYISTNPVYSNIVLANMYPSAGDTGTTVATYWENPAVAFQSNAIQLNRISSTQLNFSLNEVLELKFPGCVSIYSNDGRYAKFLLAANATSIIESGGLYTSDWSTTKDAASKLNVYYDAGKYWMQNKNGSNFFRLHFQHGF